VFLATEPGIGGEAFATLGDIPDAAAVWADFGGSLGHVRNGDGSDVMGADLKEWIRRGAILTVHRDDADPSHPVLAVTAVADPPPPVTVPPDADPVTGWATLPAARVLWPESANLGDDLLTALLAAVYPACAAFAAPLPADATPPPHYVAGQIRAAREWWTERVAYDSGDVYETPYTVAALTPKVRQTLRPTRPMVAR
jgi:hypothetical protein